MKNYADEQHENELAVIDLLGEHSPRFFDSFLEVGHWLAAKRLAKRGLIIEGPHVANVFSLKDRVDPVALPIE